MVNPGSIPGGPRKQPTKGDTVSDLAINIITLTFVSLSAIAGIYGVVTVGKTPKARTGKEAAVGVVMVAAELALILTLWLR